MSEVTSLIIRFTHIAHILQRFYVVFKIVKQLAFNVVNLLQLFQVFKRHHLLVWNYCWGHYIYLLNSLINLVSHVKNINLLLRSHYPISFSLNPPLGTAIGWPEASSSTGVFHGLSIRCGTYQNVCSRL